MTLGHADRTRIVSDDDRSRLMAEVGMRTVRTFLVDGSVSGTWRIDRSGDRATITAEPWRRIDAAGRRALIEEAGALARVVAPRRDRPRRAHRLTPVGPASGVVLGAALVGVVVGRVADHLEPLVEFDLDHASVVEPHLDLVRRTAVADL